MKVVAFNGSPRPKGNTTILLETVTTVLEAQGIETETVRVGGNQLNGCIACYKCNERADKRCNVDTDKFNEFFAKMIEADGLLLGSPVYFADLTGPLKCLIERAGFVAMANKGLLRRKVGAAVVAVRRAGAVHTLDSINHFFLISQMIVPGSSYWNLGMGRQPGEVNNDEEGLKTMKTLGENMAWLMKKIS